MDGLDLLLPEQIAALAEIPARHAFASRNTAIVEAAIFNGLRPGEMVSLNCGDLDPGATRIRRPRALSWLPLRTNHVGCWVELIDGRRDDEPVFRARDTRRLSRIDIWRVMHRVGEEAGLPMALNCRRTRKWVGYSLGQRHQVPAESVQLALGLKDVRSVVRFLPKADVADLPPLATIHPRA